MFRAAVGTWLQLFSVMGAIFSAAIRESKYFSINFFLAHLELLLKCAISSYAQSLHTCNIQTTHILSSAKTL